MHFDMTKSCFAQIIFENHTKMWKNFALTQSYKLIFDEFYLLPLLLLINKTIFSGKYFSFEKFFFLNFSDLENEMVTTMPISYHQRIQNTTMKISFPICTI